MSLSDELRKSGIKAMENLADYVERTEVEKGRLVRTVSGESDVAHAYKMGRSYHDNGPDGINCHFSVFATREQTEAWERGFSDAKRGVQP